MKIHIAQNGCFFYCRHKNNNYHQSHTIHQKQFNRFNIFANLASAWLSYASHFSRLHLCVVHIIPALVHSIEVELRFAFIVMDRELEHIFSRKRKSQQFHKNRLEEINAKKQCLKKMFIWKCDIIVLVFIPWIAAKARAKL